MRRDGLSWFVCSACRGVLVCTASVTTHYRDDTTQKNGRSREFKAASLEAAEHDAMVYWSKISTAPISNISSVIVHYVRCEKRSTSPKKASAKKRPVVPLPMPLAKAPKLLMRTWTCRVKLTWQVGPRRGSVDETWSDIEATTEASAMGAALFRSQSRLMALSLAGTRPAWPSTDVKCT